MQQLKSVWAQGTGVGSWPGTSPREATEIVLAELALPHIVELPARGVGADLIGRSAALLVDIAPDAAIEIPLYWQRWTLDSPLLDELSAAVRLVAGREMGQGPPRR